MSQKVLVVDDEQSIVTLLKYNLETAGYIVEVAYDGEEALEKVNEIQPELVVLDVMLPKKDGIEVCKTIRSDKNLVPILMLTAKDDEFDRVLGLELGADDYMTKPFSPREVVARVKAILRRSKFASEIEKADVDDEDILIENIRIRPEFFEVYKDDELLELTPKEFELLLYLIERQGRVITREHMLNSVWNYEFAGDSRIVDVHISHLRDKLEENPKQPKLIKTVRGLGYKLERPKSLMLKFHHRLLLLLSTITIISFIGLGVIIHHTIYQILSTAQVTELKHVSENFLKLNKQNENNEIKNISANQNLIVRISENGKVIYQTGNQNKINDNIDNEANPSNIIYKRENGQVRYTFKTTVNDKTIYISGMNTEILELQKSMWKYLSLIGIIVLLAIYLAVRSINRTYIRPINEVTYATSLIADGYYHVRVPESNVKETKALFVTTNDLARRLQKLNNKQKCNQID